MAARRFAPDGSAFDSAPFLLAEANDQIPGDHYEQYTDPSLVVSSSGLVHVVFTSLCEECRFPMACNCGPSGECPCQKGINGQLLLESDFSFNTIPAPVSLPVSLDDFRLDREPSAGLAGGSTFDAWDRHYLNTDLCSPDDCVSPIGAPFGWVAGTDPDNVTTTFVSCNPCAPSPPGCFFNVANPLPCVAGRSDGYSLVVWADPEAPSSAFSHFNIKLRAFDSNGSPITSAFYVNNTFPLTNPEQFPSSQISPAVALNDADANGVSDVVVVWMGPYPDGCDPSPAVFARRLKFNPSSGFFDPDPSAGEGSPGQFVVNNQADFGPFQLLDAHPTVAITSEPSHRGRCIVAWNSYAPDGYQVHGQYLESNGRALGREFRMHVETGPLQTGSFGSRQLAPSARHTLSYGKQGQVVVAFTWQWDPGDASAEDQVWASLIPSTQPAALDEETCCKGDANLDNAVNGRDVQQFVDLLFEGLAALHCRSIADLCPADMNEDGAVDLTDVPPFTAALLVGLPCGQGPRMYSSDCNTNGQPDVNDIGEGTSEDCNENGIPDECDIDEGDPDGNEEVSNDLNTNGIPDECEDDCNSNGIPDGKDIDDETSGDCDTNGIPDECEPDCNTNGVVDACDVDVTDPDGNSQVSADCDDNKEPDECQQDCNTNGVPDTCDIDPEDPDGDEWVSPDCNGNEFPDECDLALGAGWGSLDCNTNGIPDECDIAVCESDPACGDCNENGIPDACDIAAEISEDANTNGIPDECEGEGMMGAGGGESMMMAGGEGTAEGGYAPEAWEAFYEWSAEQCWGPACETSGAEQFAAMVAKLKELGLPVQGRSIAP